MTAPPAMTSPRVFSIPAGVDFIAVFLEALLAGTLNGVVYRDTPHALGRLTLYVPTRRLAPVLGEALARALAPQAVLLPRIVPLAEPEAEEGDFPFTDMADTETAQNTPEAGEKTAPPSAVLSPLARIFRLLPLVEAWQKARAPEETPLLVHSLQLAEALGRLIDECAYAGVPVATLAKPGWSDIDPALQDDYWHEVRSFLAIMAQTWPSILTEGGYEDEAAARLRKLSAQAEQLATHPERAVIVMGSTGSIAATRQLMRVVSRLPHGGVVLPGLDRALDAAGWALIADAKSSLATRHAHPQGMLKRTLTDIGLPREAVIELGQGLTVQSETDRARLLSAALRPAEQLRPVWAEPASPEALASLIAIEAENEREEALAIALVIRQTLAQTTGRIALITPDRALAHRVGVEVKRWGITLEDSANIRFCETEAGRLVIRALEAMEKPQSVPLIALMQHPLFRLGYPQTQAQALVEALEIAVLRGHRFSPDLSLVERVRWAGDARQQPGQRVHRAVGRLAPEHLDELPAFAKALDAALAPLATGTIADQIAQLRARIWTLTAEDTDFPAGDCAFSRALHAQRFEDLLDQLAQAAGEWRLNPADFLRLIGYFVQKLTLPPLKAASSFQGVRALVLGTLEARLLHFDRVILAGLNEGVFPPLPKEDPLLSRAMRAHFGLEPPERRIGQAAHDFFMLAGMRNNVLTRAKRAGNAPAIPSRFWRRLEAQIGPEEWEKRLQAGAELRTLARALDAPARFCPVARPAPVPQAPRLPAKLSITEIETLRRDPYALYARHFLGLEPLPPLDPAPDSRDFGTMMHAAFEQFSRLAPYPDDPQTALRTLGAAIFAPLQHEREVHAFWWQHFLRLVPAFLAFDAQSRRDKRIVFAEIFGEMPLLLPDGSSLRLRGKADRIERAGPGEDSPAAIFDFKTTAPKNAQVYAGLAPQLLVTAAMLQRGAFARVGPLQEPVRLAYLPLRGEQALQPQWLDNAKNTPDMAILIETTFARLIEELTTLAQGKRGYTAQLFPKNTDYAGDYDHLARVAEWSLALEEAPDPEEGEA